MNANYIQVENCEPFGLSAVPLLPESAFRDVIAEKVRTGEHIASYFGKPEEGGLVRLIAILTDDKTGKLSVLSMMADKTYQSVTPICAQAHMFEREIAETWGVVPKGHPWLKPVRFIPPLSGDRDAWGRNEIDSIQPADTDYYKVSGDEVHEVAVGPVHAGVIEPGHFRFQCNGETVFTLEIVLGFQHRGIEKNLAGGPDNRTLYLMETAAGDSSIAHATAYCQALEGLTGTLISPRAEILRAVALELERLANHTGDLGALANDVAYLPTSSFCGRIRGDYLNMTARLCGNRFGRRFVCPGGVREDMSPEGVLGLAETLKKVFADTENAVDLLWKTPSVMSRFESTGRITSSICNLLGIVGMPARACGQDVDTRAHFPYGAYKNYNMHVARADSGDVYARAWIRWLEIISSKNFILEHLCYLPSGETRVELDQNKLPADTCVVSMVEGWRGEVCHTAVTDSTGRFAAYKIVDPSFHNWVGLAMALRDEQISNFPLCNKSFNLSYCGHDL